MAAVISALVLAGSACGLPVRVDTLEPGFDGTRIVRMRGNVLPTPLRGGGEMELNVERVERPGQEPEHALLVEVGSPNLRLREGERLLLMVDGDTMWVDRDSLAGPWTRFDRSVGEQARYPVEEAALRRLLAGRAVQVSVRAAAWWERRALSPGNLATIRSFVERHVPVQTAP